MHRAHERHRDVGQDRRDLLHGAAVDLDRVRVHEDLERRLDLPSPDILAFLRLRPHVQDEVQEPLAERDRELLPFRDEALAQGRTRVQEPDRRDEGVDRVAPGRHQRDVEGPAGDGNVELGVEARQTGDDSLARRDSEAVEDREEGRAAEQALDVGHGQRRRRGTVDTVERQPDGGAGQRDELQQDLEVEWKDLGWVTAETPLDGPRQQQAGVRVGIRRG